MALSANVPSYLQPTASTAQRATSSKRTRHPTSTRHVLAQSNAPFPPSKDARLTLGDDSLPKGDVKSSVPKSRVMGGPAAQPSHSLHSESRLVRPEPHHDTLQVAAQVQSWLFMQSNLQDSLSVVQKRVQDTHNVLAEVIVNDSSGTSRSDIEELVAFLDDLSNAGSETGLALFVDQFLEHERSWLKLHSELTQFIARLSQAPTASPLEEGQNIKARLSEEVSRIESLVTKAEVWRNEPDRIHHMLSQLYPLLRARSDNASMASDAIDCSLDNILAMRRLRE